MLCSVRMQVSNARPALRVGPCSHRLSVRMLLVIACRYHNGGSVNNAKVDLNWLGISVFLMGLWLQIVMCTMK